MSRTATKHRRAPAPSLPGQAYQARGARARGSSSRSRTRRRRGARADSSAVHERSAWPTPSISPAVATWGRTLKHRRWRWVSRLDRPAEHKPSASSESVAYRIPVHRDQELDISNEAPRRHVVLGGLEERTSQYHGNSAHRAEREKHESLLDRT